VLLGQRDASLYESIAESLRQNGQFEQVSVDLFGHDVVYSSESWVELARSHSDHRTLPPDQLAALLDDVRAGIDRAGGDIPVHYEVTLVTGLRR
jgi:hypothetical protein